jgi:hypothetical protein
LKGLKKYGQSGNRSSPTEPRFSQKAIDPQWREGKGSVVGVGFCAKPLDPVCLSGRANHDCAYFEKHLYLGQDPKPEPCRNCVIREIGLAALISKSDFYIMTSAKDILNDLFLPAIHLRKYSQALLGLCFYSFEPFKMALYISGIEALLFPFEKGDCEDYRTWRQADRGIKDTQTQLRNHDLKAILTFLKNPKHKNNLAHKYQKRGNIFQIDA